MLLLRVLRTILLNTPANATVTIVANDTFHSPANATAMTVANDTFHFPS